MCFQAQSDLYLPVSRILWDRSIEDCRDGGVHLQLKTSHLTPLANDDIKVPKLPDDSNTAGDGAETHATECVKRNDGRGEDGRGARRRSFTPLATCDVNLEVGKDKRGKVGNETIAYKMYSIVIYRDRIAEIAESCARWLG